VSGGAFVLANGMQAGNAPGSDTPVVVFMIAGLVLACVGIFVLFRRRRRRRPRKASDQWQALAVMGELCPHGWQAEITLYGWGAPVPDDAPPSRAPLVELEWKQFDE
jgi:LPXTG-motif cell wall-anchored protein